MRSRSPGSPEWSARARRADVVARWSKPPGAARRKIAVDRDTIRELTLLLDETGLSEIEIEQDGQRIRVARNVVASPPAPNPANPGAAATTVPSLAPIASGSIEPAKHPGVVTSP